MGGQDSLEKGYKEAVEKGFKNIHLMSGTHIVTDWVTFEVPMTVSGDGRHKTFVEGGGFDIQGGWDKSDQKITFMDLTIQKTERSGLSGSGGMSFECIRLHFHKCGGYGVGASNTKGRLTNCQVTHCKMSGVYSENSTIELEGEETRLENNCTNGESHEYGLDTYASSTIHLLSPLKKESVSKNNKGGGNYLRNGKIETVRIFPREEKEAYIKANGKIVAMKLNVKLNQIVFVLPGTDSLKNGYDEAVRKGFKNIHLIKGTHIVTETYVIFEVPMIVSGDGREMTFVEGGGLKIEGARGPKCTFIDMTIQKTKESGLSGDEKGMSFDCIRVRFEKN